jgi:hypothetical protein
MNKIAITAAFLAVASATPIDDAYKAEKAFYKAEADKKKDADRREERSHQSYAQVQDPALKDVENVSSFSAMVSGAMDANNLNITMPAVAKNTTAAVQIEGKSKWEIGALKGYADTDEILDMQGNVQTEALYGIPSHQTLLEMYMQPSN